jgi:integrase
MPATAGLDELVREAEKEAALATEVAKATRLTYEGKARQLRGGWDLASACKRSRYSMRAAGQWVMRRELRALVKEAKRVRKSGETGEELHAVRELQFAFRMEKVKAKLDAIREFHALPWAEIEDPGRRLQRSHRKRPAKDAELIAFYEAAETSSFLVHLLVAEFSGCRGEEFREGVRVEASKIDGVATLSFYIQSAKADGKKKGLDVRCVQVPFPGDASEDVRRRWQRLATLATQERTFVARIEPTEKMTAGQRFTNGAKFIAKKAEVDVACYSMRHRFAAQVKAASGGDSVAVALALGHQTTRTQAHYARAHRGGGGLSPVLARGVAVPGTQAVRGAARRTGPPLQTKERVQLGAAVAPPAVPRRPRGPRL